MHLYDKNYVKKVHILALSVDEHMILTWREKIMAFQQEIETKLQKGISVSTNEEIYYALLDLVKENAVVDNTLAEEKTEETAE